MQIIQPIAKPPHIIREELRNSNLQYMGSMACTYLMSLPSIDLVLLFVGIFLETELPTFHFGVKPNLSTDQASLWNSMKF